MEGLVELNDITGHAVNEDEEHAYDMLPAASDKTYENLKINTLAEAMTDSDGPTRMSDRVNVSKPEAYTGACRKLDIAFAIISGGLLLLLVISCITIGFMIQELNKRADTADELHAMVSKLQYKLEGQLGPWSMFSPCSATCGAGTHYRKRSCNNSSLELNGWSCPRTDIDIQPCNIGPCQPEWEVWSQFSECSQSCGGGTQSRKRACINTSSAECSGDSSESRSCNAEICPVNGGWSTWSSWSSCTKTCNSGHKERHRTCSNPAPVGLGRTCSGNSDSLAICNDSPCPEWGVWSKFSECSQSCGGGTQSRKRTCINTSSAECSGDSSESQPCNNKVCPDQKSAFAIFMSSTTYNSSVLRFSFTKLNIGGDYDSTTGLFTCRIPGLYVFILNLFRRHEAGGVGCHIYKNSGQVTYAEAPANSGNDSNGSGSAVVHLNHGGTVYVGGCYGTNNIGLRTSFIGFLLQAD